MKTAILCLQTKSNVERKKKKKKATKITTDETKSPYENDAKQKSQLHDRLKSSQTLAKQSS